MEPKALDLGELREDPRNPREISAGALEGLKTSLAEFGDLSGIVLNIRTGFLVAGHQRMKGLREQHGEGLKIEGGAVVTPEGERFPVRVVDWGAKKAKFANMAANSPTIAGKFKEEALPYLKEIQEDFGDLFKDMELENLMANLEEDFGSFEVDGVEAPGLASGDRPHFQQMTFTLHDDQAERVKLSLGLAIAKAPFENSKNENSNGNALARIAEAFLGKS